MHPSRYVAPALLTVSCCARLRPFVAPQPAAGLQPHLLVPRGCLAASVASSACCTVVLTVLVCVCRTWGTWSVTLGQPHSHLVGRCGNRPLCQSFDCARRRGARPVALAAPLLSAGHLDPSYLCMICWWQVDEVWWAAPPRNGATRHHPCILP